MPLEGQKDTKVIQSSATVPLSSSFSSKHVFRQPIMYDKDNNLIKSLTFGSPRLDEKICFKSGMNLFFGASDVGKTNASIRLAFEALNKGWKVIYYDLEDGVDPERLIQVYKSNSWNFKFEKLYDSFVKPAHLNWKEITDDFARIINLEKPDLFIIDAITPLFLKEFMRAEDNRWFVTNKRENLCFDLWEQCHDSKNITVIVAHAKTPKTEKKKHEDFKSQLDRLTSEPELFTGVGNRIAYLSKQWLYFFKVIDDKGELHRYIAIFKRKVGKDYFDSRELIEFKITDRGIE